MERKIADAMSNCLVMVLGTQLQLSHFAGVSPHI